MKRILVVEDEAAIADLLALILEDAGYQVEIAENGLVAWNRLEERRPELVISDLMMPFLNGWDLLAQMRAHSDYQSIPVILMSAAHPSTAPQGFSGTTFIPKPFDLDHLLESVEQNVGPTP